MIDFIDKTTEQSGTPLNRDNMLAIQGFVGCTVQRKSNGSIVETNTNGDTLTTVKGTDGSITQTFVGGSSGKTIKMKTTFSGNTITSEIINE